MAKTFLIKSQGKNWCFLRSNISPLTGLMRLWFRKYMSNRVIYWSIKLFCHNLYFGQVIRCWRTLFIQYWAYLIYLKLIHSPNIMSPIILYKFYFGILIKVLSWRDRNQQIWFRNLSTIFVLVHFCYTYLLLYLVLISYWT